MEIFTSIIRKLHFTQNIKLSFREKFKGRAELNYAPEAISIGYLYIIFKTELNYKLKINMLLSFFKL